MSTSTTAAASARLPDTCVSSDSAYYTAFIEAAPEGTQDLYTFDECWEDYMLGQFLWGLAYTKINLQALPKVYAKAEVRIDRH